MEMPRTLIGKLEFTVRIKKTHNLTMAKWALGELNILDEFRVAVLYICIGHSSIFGQNNSMIDITSGKSIIRARLLGSIIKFLDAIDRCAERLDLHSYQDFLILLGREKSVLPGLSLYIDKIQNLFQTIGKKGMSSVLPDELNMLAASLDDDYSKKIIRVLGTIYLAAIENIDLEKTVSENGILNLSLIMDENLNLGWQKDLLDYYANKTALKIYEKTFVIENCLKENSIVFNKIYLRGSKGLSEIKPS